MDLVIKDLDKDQSNTIAAFAHAVKVGMKNIEVQHPQTLMWSDAQDDFFDFDCHLNYRIKPLPSYPDLHKKSGLEVGDRVKIIVDLVEEENGYKFTREDQRLQGYKNYIGEITWDVGERGFWVDGDKLLPYYALELVKKKPEEEWIIKYKIDGIFILRPDIFKSKSEAKSFWKKFWNLGFRPEVEFIKIN